MSTLKLQKFPNEKLTSDLLHIDLAGNMISELGVEQSYPKVQTLSLAKNQF